MNLKYSVAYFERKSKYALFVSFFDPVPRHRRYSVRKNSVTSKKMKRKKVKSEE